MKMSRIYILISIFILVIFPISSTGNAFKNDFYFLGTGKIEIRGLSTNGSASTIKMQSFEGKSFELKDPPLLSSNDFEGISKIGSDIVIYIKRKSWAKVRKITKENINKQLAIVISNKVASAPVVIEPLSHKLYISGHKITTDNFKNFIQGKKPEYLEDQKEYIQFMESWIYENTKDFSALQELALLYITDLNGSINHESLKPGNCTKAIPLFKKLINEKPTETYHYINLSQCYLASSEYNSALSVIESSMPYYPEDQKWHAYLGIGFVHIMNGSYDKALAILEKSKKLLKNTKMLPAGTTLEAANMFFSVAPGPNGSKMRFDTIEELESHLKQNSMDKIEELFQKAKEGKNKNLTKR